MRIEDARELIDEGLRYTEGSHLFEDVVEMIEKGLLQCWTNRDSICLTEILQSPRKKIFNVWLAAGNLTDLMEMYPDVEQWAREQGCTIATFTGRPGWTRSFLSKEQGWTGQLVVMTKAL